MIKGFITFGWIAGFFMTTWVSVSTAESLQEFTLTSMVVQGAKVWSPATLTIPKGHAVKLKLKNTTDAAHGFSIDELNIKEVIPPGEVKEVTIKVDQAGSMRFYCHLHPAHVGGELVVE